MAIADRLQQTQARTQSRVRQMIDAVRAKWHNSPAFHSQTETPPGETMTPATTHDVTQLLLAWRNGDAQALEQLTPLVYDELRRLAASYLRRERADHTLQATALVNEAYLQLINQQRVAQVNWQSRAHFMGIAARLMRQILVDHARTHAAAKRGQGAAALPLEEAIEVPGQPAPNVIALDDALRDLAKLDARKSHLIELRYFGGLSMDEIAEVTSLSLATIRRDMRMAEAWLGRQMQK